MSKQPIELYIKMSDVFRERLDLYKQERNVKTDEQALIILISKGMEKFMEELREEVKA